MRLYLSSYRLGSEPERLQKLVERRGRAGLIFNARDVYENRARDYERDADDLRSLDFETEELDLRAYFGDPTALQSHLATYDLLWVAGGNSFVLARAMNRSGFPDAAADLVRDDRVVYAGYSAGACVTGPDLNGMHLMDDPDVIPEGYDRSTPIQTLGWIPWRVVPHWRSDEPSAGTGGELLGG